MATAHPDTSLEHAPVPPASASRPALPKCSLRTSMERKTHAALPFGTLGPWLMAIHQAEESL